MITQDPTISRASAGLTAAGIDNDVKLVIWDLDDTFWKGTLAEEGVELIEGHAEIVRKLALRGILSSVASKNHHETAKEILERAGIWDYFVFTSISFDPKGEKIAEIISNAALRAENVLFIDDNVSNLEEVRFYNPGIMVALPGDIVPHLLDHPRLEGKPDPDLKRLKQYQLLQRKFIDQSSTHLSNEVFLRSSEIKIYFDFDIDKHFDRVVDLINRTNQLNYTKQRLQSQEDVEEFKLSLNGYGVAAACVSCSDRYGNYGIIGFFMLRRDDKQIELNHFVFSCRTMNMGIERFVYYYLGKPEIRIVPEVAYGLEQDSTIDWILVTQAPVENASLASSERALLLVGGCELQQLASFCSANRVEFVNKMSTSNGDDYIVRYDDPYFFIADRETLSRNKTLPNLIGAWSYQDAVLLDRHVAQSELIILAMRAVLRHYFVVAKQDNIRIRTEVRNIELHKKNRSDWFQQNFSVINIGMRERLDLIRQALEAVGRRSARSAIVFVIGSNTRKIGDPMERTASVVYNKFCEKFCQENQGKFHYVDVDRIVPEECLVDTDHYTRVGYHALSAHINNVVSNSENRPSAPLTGHPMPLDRAPG